MTGKPSQDHEPDAGLESLLDAALGASSVVPPDDLADRVLASTRLRLAGRRSDVLGRIGPSLWRNAAMAAVVGLAATIALLISTSPSRLDGSYAAVWDDTQHELELLAFEIEALRMTSQSASAWDAASADLEQELLRLELGYDDSDVLTEF